MQKLNAQVLKNKLGLVISDIMTQNVYNVRLILFAKARYQLLPHFSILKRLIVNLQNNIKGVLYIRWYNIFKIR